MSKKPTKNVLHIKVKCGYSLDQKEQNILIIQIFATNKASKNVVSYVLTFMCVYLFRMVCRK